MNKGTGIAVPPVLIHQPVGPCREAYGGRQSDGRRGDCKRGDRERVEARTF
jgi:hypothetical protein